MNSQEKLYIVYCGLNDKRYKGIEDVLENELDSKEILDM